MLTARELHNFLQTYNKPNVKLVTERMEEITPKGIRTADGHEYELDTIIFATGFDLIKSANAAKITGVGGTDWEKLIGDTPAAFNGVVVVREIFRWNLHAPFNTACPLSA